jgi:hypothetical protein
MPGRSEDLIIRELGRQFESVIDRLADELSSIQASSINPVDHQAYEAAINEIATVLETSGASKLSQTAILRSVPTDIARRFLEDIESRWKVVRVEDRTKRLGRLALELCCYALKAWAHALPAPLSGNSAWVTLANSTYLIEQSRKMLSELRRAGAFGGDGSPRIIGNQRSDLSSALGRLELFGLPVAKRLRWVPIEIAYLSARVTLRAGQKQSTAVPLEDVIQLSLTKSNKRSSSGTRLVIVGKAGSGKTTAAQWLAFRAAQQRLHAFNSSPRQVLPLYVQLRDTVPHRSIPNDRTLLYSDQLRDEAASDWLEVCAKDANLLIILDGWDELSPERRTIAHQWVDSLNRRFPSAHIIITSRPEGLDGSLDQLAFGRVDMVPLTPEDARELASRWFRGLANNLHSNPDYDMGSITQAHDELVHDLTTPSISEMADSPLLISMLCCLYADGYTTAPNKRGELYDMVTSALIDRRELERRIDASIWETYNHKQKEELLGAIARQMSMGEMLQLSINVSHANIDKVPSLKQLLTQVLQDIGRSPTELSELTEAILNRSIVLQRVGNEETEFAHKSIQDYFAARAFQQSSDLSTMFSVVENHSQWGLLPFACHQASRTVTDSIVEWILARAREATGDRARAIQYILVECLGAATSITPGLRNEAQSVVAEMFPPRDEAEAKSLAATLGNSAIEYLHCANMNDSDRRLAINTIGRVGTNEALKALSDYAYVATTSDIDELVSAWGRFDAINYARRVLSRVQHTLTLTLSDEARLVAASHLDCITKITTRRLHFSSIGLAKFGQVSGLREVAMLDCHGLTDVEWTTNLRLLKRLSIARCEGLTRLAELAPTTLWDLHLEELQLQHVDWIACLGRLRELRTVWVTNVTRRRDNVIPSEAFSTMRNLHTLVVSGDSRCQSLDFIKRNGRLTRVSLGWPLTDADIVNLTRCQSLRHLDISLLGDVPYATQLSSLKGLTSLRLRGAWPALIGVLAARLPNLVSVHLDSGDIGRLEELSLSPGVRRLTLSGCTFREESMPIPTARGAEISESLGQIEEFTWRGGELQGLQFLHHMPSLRHLDIEDDGSLTSLADLEAVPQDCTIRLVGSPYGLDDSPINILRRRGNVVSYAPNYDVEIDGFYIDLGGN